MVVKKILGGLILALVICGTARADEDMLIRQISADACDTRLSGDDAKTAENRAIDKAGLAAIKTSGLIQSYYPKLSDMTLNLIAYRIIDEYLYDVTHEVTLDDNQQVCVHLDASLELPPEDLHVLAAEYKSSAIITDTQTLQIAQEVQQETTFKPQNLNEKKLLYVSPLQFWNDVTTNNYITDIKQHLIGSDYFYVTDDKSMADYTIEPYVETAHVDNVDAKNRKMEVMLELRLSALQDENFNPLIEKQSHFILFAAENDEQQVADTLIRKLLSRAATNMADKINRVMAERLEQHKRQE